MGAKRRPFSNGWGDCGDTIFLIFKMGTKSVPILKIKQIKFHCVRKLIFGDPKNKKLDSQIPNFIKKYQGLAETMRYLKELPLYAILFGSNVSTR